MAKQVVLGFDVPVEVHAHERGKLGKAGIDAAPAPFSAVGRHRSGCARTSRSAARRQPIDLGRVDPGVDRAGHQRHAARLRRVFVLGHDRDRGERRDAGLAHREEMRAGADGFEKCDDMVDKIVETERGRSDSGMSRAFFQSVM